MKADIWCKGGVGTSTSVRASFPLSLINIPVLESVKLLRFESSSCIKPSSRSSGIDWIRRCKKVRLNICTVYSKNLTNTRRKGGVGSYCSYCILEVRTVACADTSSTQGFCNNGTESSSSMKQPWKDDVVEIDVKPWLSADNDDHTDSDRIFAAEATVEGRAIFQIGVADSNHNEGKTQHNRDTYISNVKESSLYKENGMFNGNPDALALRTSQCIGVPMKKARSSSLDGRQNAKIYGIDNSSESKLYKVDGEANTLEILQWEERLSNGSLEHNDNETVLRRLLRERGEAAKTINDNKLAVKSNIISLTADTIDEGNKELLEIDENSKTYKDMVAFQRSLSLKRQNVAKVIQDAMQASKLGPEYSKRVIASMPSFVDRVLMKAVALKRKPKYSALPFSSRARLIVDKSKVGELVKWLKHNGISLPRVGFLICHAGDELDIVRPRIQFLKQNYVKGRELGVVISREPSILEQSEEELNTRVSFLEDSGIKKEMMGLVVSRSPGVLALSDDEIHKKVTFLLELGMEKEQFGSMIFNFPSLLGGFSKEEMEKRVDYLRRFGFESPTLGKIIAKKPQLLACSIEEAWQPITKFLYYLGVDRAGMRRILEVQPSVFCLSLSENIAPKVRFLRAIGVHEQEIGRVLVQFPAILTYSLDKKIRPVVRFLLERAGITEEDIGKVVASEPRLIGCSLTNKLQIIVRYLLSLGISARQLGEMVANFPMLLMYNKEVLIPKYRYFSKVMEQPLEELIAFPRFFSYALQTRIVPRHEILLEKGIRMKLRYMLACTDSEFQERIKCAEERKSTGADREASVEVQSDSV